MAEQQRERDIAEMEVQMAHDTDQYFEARPQIMRTRDKETTFEAGFKAAWKARALSHAEGEANWRKWWKPDVCPITRAPFFMWIEHPDDGWVPTYGGPYDSYTIPVFDGESYTRQRYDHDEGGWCVGEVEDVGVQIVDDQLYVTDQDPSHPAPQVAVQEYVVTSEDEDVISGIGNNFDVARECLARAQEEQPDKVWDLVAVLDQGRLAAAPTEDIPQVTAYDHSIPVTVTSSDDEQPVSDPDGLELGLAAEAAKHLTSWLDMDLCDCEDVCRCGRTHVRACRDRLLEAAAAPAPDEREIATYRQALEEIAPYPSSRDVELGYSACRRIASAALKQGDRLRAGKGGQDND
ncbi:hypothetical protein ACEK07_45875 [Alcanivoracaceae bacterium MT1]